MPTIYHLEKEGECTFCHCTAKLVNVVDDNDIIALGVCGPCKDFWIYAPNKKDDVFLQEDYVAMMSAIAADVTCRAFGYQPRWEKKDGPWDPDRYRK